MIISTDKKNLLFRFDEDNIDESVVKEVKEQILEEIKVYDPNSITFDLYGVKNIEMSFIHLCIAGTKAVKFHSLKIVNANLAIKETLKTLELDKVFTVI
jgi:anti-anti-sigma regulatory factor